MKALAALSVLALCGCATTYQAHFVNDQHPEYTQADANRDAYQCMRENAAPSFSGYAVANTAAAEGGTTVNPMLLRACLAAKGWRELPRPWYDRL